MNRILTLRRFQSLLDSYGADLRRWPIEDHAKAVELLRLSSEARARLSEAEDIDDLLRAASEAADARQRSLPEDEAALARIRANVGARISSDAQWRPHTRSSPIWRPAVVFSGAMQLNRAWLSLVVSGGAAVAVGLAIGLGYGIPTAPDAFMPLFQASPFHHLPF